MENINDLLNSLSAEDMDRLKSVASSLMSGKKNGQPEQPMSGGISSLVGDNTTELLIKVAEQMNRENDRTAFIKALRPLLSEERRQKADDAVRFMKLMDALPLLKGLI